MITNFPSPKSYNPGGLSSFKFIPLHDIDFFPSIANGSAESAIVLKAGKSWSTGYSTADTLQLTEKVESTPNGPMVMQNLAGFVPGNNDILVQLLFGMQEVPFLVIVKDKSNKIRLLGLPNNGLLFTASFDSGQKRSSSVGYEFQFATSAIFPAPYYPF